MRCPECQFENSGTRLKCEQCGSLLDPKILDKFENTIQPLTPKPKDEQPTAPTLPMTGTPPAGAENPGNTMEFMPPPAMPASDEPDPNAEVVAGRFRVVRDLGEGGMGAVQLAHDMNMGRDVAIKRILSLDEASRMRFRSEARAIAALNHQNIGQVFDYLETEDEPLMVMEFIPGKTLKSAVIDDGPMPYDKMMHVAKGMARALDFCHRNNVVHRDIKPANVLLDRGGNPKIIDFGLGRQAGDGLELTQTGMGMGTLDYASPEQKIDAKNVDGRSDVYSYGLTLYFAVTGESPRVMRESRIPDEWKELILKCTEDRPEDRYQSMETVLAALEAGKSSSVVASKVGGGGQGEGPTCSSCGAVNTPNARFCRKCRAGLFIKCPECNNEERDDGQFCGNCGFDIPAYKEYEERIRKARMHFDRNEYVMAADEARGAQSLLPDRSEAGDLLGRIDELQGKVRETRQKAKAAQAKGEYKQAVDLYEQLIGLEPDDATANTGLQECRKAFFEQLVAQIEAAIDAGKLDTARRNIAKVAASKYAGEAEKERLDELRVRIDGNRNIAKDEAVARFDKALSGPGGASEADEALTEIANLGASDNELDKLRVRLDYYRSNESLQHSMDLKDWDTCLSLMDAMRDMDVPGDAATKTARSAALRQSATDLFHGCLADREYDLCEDGIGLLGALGERKGKVDELQRLLNGRRRARGRKKLLVSMLVLLVILGSAGGGGWFYLKDANAKALDAILADLAAGRSHEASLATFVDVPAQVRDLLPPDLDLGWPAQSEVEGLVDAYARRDQLSTRGLLRLEAQIADLAGDHAALGQAIGEVVSARLLITAPTTLRVEDGVLPNWGGHDVARIALGNNSSQDEFAARDDGSFLVGDVDLSSVGYMDMTDPFGHDARVVLTAPAAPLEAWPELTDDAAVAMLSRDLQDDPPPLGLQELARRVFPAWTGAVRRAGFTGSEQLVAARELAGNHGLDRDEPVLTSTFAEIDAFGQEEWGSVPDDIEYSREFRLDSSVARYRSKGLDFPALVHIDTGLRFRYVPAGYVADRDVPGAVWYVPGFYASEALLGRAQLGVEAPDVAAPGDLAEPGAGTDPVDSVGAGEPLDEPGADPADEAGPIPHWLAAGMSGRVADLVGSHSFMELPSLVQVWHVDREAEPLPEDAPPGSVQAPSLFGLADTGAAQWTADVVDGERVTSAARQQPESHDIDLVAGAYVRAVVPVHYDQETAELRLAISAGADWGDWNNAADVQTWATFVDTELPDNRQVELIATPLDASGVIDAERAEVRMAIGAKGDQKQQAPVGERLVDGRWFLSAALVSEDAGPIPLGLFDGDLGADVATEKLPYWKDLTDPEVGANIEVQKKVQNRLRLEVVCRDATSGIDQVFLDDQPLEHRGDGLYVAVDIPAKEDPGVDEEADLRIVDEAGRETVDTLTFSADKTERNVADLALDLPEGVTSLQRDGVWLLPRRMQDQTVDLVAAMSMREGDAVSLAGVDVVAQVAAGGEVRTPVELREGGGPLHAIVADEIDVALEYAFVDPPRLTVPSKAEIKTQTSPSPDIAFSVGGELGGQVALRSDVEGDSFSSGADLTFDGDAPREVAFKVTMPTEGDRTLSIVASDALGQTDDVTIPIYFDRTPPAVTDCNFSNANRVKVGCNKHQISKSCAWAICESDAEAAFKVDFSEWIHFSGAAPAGLGINSINRGIEHVLSPGAPPSSQIQVAVEDRAQVVTQLIVHAGVARKGATGSAGSAVLSAGVAADGSVRLATAPTGGGFGRLMSMDGATSTATPAAFVSNIDAVLDESWTGDELTRAVAIAPNAAYVALGGHEGRIEITRATEDPAVRGAGGEVRMLAFSTDSSTLVSANASDEVALFDASPGGDDSALGRFEAGAAVVDVACATRASGRAVAITENRVVAWQVGFDAPVTAAIPTGRGAHVSLSNDGTRIAVATQFTIYTWTWSGASLTGPVEMDSLFGVSALAFDDAGLFLLVGTEKGVVSVRAFSDARNGDAKLIDLGDLVDLGERVEVTSLAIAGSGNQVRGVAGLENGDVHSWLLPADLFRP